MQLAWIIIFLSTAIATPLFKNIRDATVVQGQYIVKFQDQAGRVSTQNLRDSLSTPPKHEYSLPGFYGFAGALTDAELSQLQASDQVHNLAQSF
jgi:hypothetical protein